MRRRAKHGESPSRRMRAIVDRVAEHGSLPALHLIAMRVKYGADSPIGNRCSNLVEMLQNYEGAEPVRRKLLAKNIEKQMAELAKLTATPHADHHEGDYPGLDKGSKSFFKRLRQCGIVILILCVLWPRCAEAKELHSFYPIMRSVLANAILYNHLVAGFSEVRLLENVGVFNTEPNEQVSLIRNDLLIFAPRDLNGGSESRLSASNCRIASQRGLFFEKGRLFLCDQNAIAPHLVYVSRSNASIFKHGPNLDCLNKLAIIGPCVSDLEIGVRDISSQLFLSRIFSASYELISSASQKDSGSAQNGGESREHQSPERYPKLIVGSKEAVKSSEPVWPVIVAIFFVAFGPVFGVIASSYYGWFKTGLLIHGLWLAGIFIVCIGVGLT